MSMVILNKKHNARFPVDGAALFPIAHWIDSCSLAFFLSQFIYMSLAMSDTIKDDQDDDPFALQIDTKNRCYNVFPIDDGEHQLKCSTEGIKTFLRCCDAMLERDPELYDLWIDDRRFYAHAIVEVLENEFNSLHHKCLYSNLKPLQGFRWLEGLSIVIGTYSRYLLELNNKDKLDALLNLFYAAWITFFVHNRYAILTLSCPPSLPDANNNRDASLETTTTTIPDKKTNNNQLNKTDEQIVRHIEKHLPNFDQVLFEVIELGYELSSSSLSNLEKLVALFQSWIYPIAGKRKAQSGSNPSKKRVKNESGTIIKPDDHADDLSSIGDFDWKLTFYDQFLLYGDRFYPVVKLPPSKRRTIGGERFVLNKWLPAKINYFLTRNLLQRTDDNEFEKQIAQLYR